MSKVAVMGGGPAGLYFGISLKLKNPSANITIIERNKATDTFGWGVVLSDETLDNLENNDQVSARDIRKNFAYWDDIALHHQGTKTRNRIRYKFKFRNRGRSCRKLHGEI